MYNVIGIESNEVFCHLANGVEVYAINDTNDNLINLKYETVDRVLEIIDKNYYACFIINHEERG